MLKFVIIGVFFGIHFLICLYFCSEFFEFGNFPVELLCIFLDNFGTAFGISLF